MPLLKCDHLCWCWCLSLHFWPWPLTVPNGQCWQWLLIMHIFSFDPHHLPQMMLMLMVFPNFDSHTHPNIWVSYMLWPWKLTLPNGCWCLLIDAHTHPPPFDLDRRPCQMARKAELGNQAGAGDAQPIFWRTGNLVLRVQPIGRWMLKPAI